MNSKTIAVENGSNNYCNTSTTKNNTLDLKPSGSITDEDEVRCRVADDYVLNNEIITKFVDYTDSGHLSEETQISSVECNDCPNIRDALSRMTCDDLEQFLNVYKLITSRDPNVDETLNKASMEQLLSGELLDGKRFKEHSAAEVEPESTDKESMDYSSAADDYTVFGVYDHIEGWKKRMQPMMSEIENIAQECKTIMIEDASAAVDGSKNKGRVSESSLERLPIENNDVTTSYSCYLSNIDKYIEINENHKFLSEVNQSQTTGDHGVRNGKAILHSDERNMQNTEDIVDLNEMRIPQIYKENRRTLLIPSNAYIKSGYKTNKDKLEVKTYLIE